MCKLVLCYMFQQIDIFKEMKYKGINNTNTLIYYVQC